MKKVERSDISIADELSDITNKTDEHLRGFDRAMTLTDEIHSLKRTAEFINLKILEKEFQLLSQQRINREMDEALINTRCFNLSKKRGGGSYRALSA